MNLVVITALIAVCGAAKLDRTYLPPASAKTAGGSPGSLQTPFAANTLNNGLGGLPKGSYENDFQGVVVDAAAPGTRGSEPGETGLGASRISYGSTNSKVGSAAFKTRPSAFAPAQPDETQEFQGAQGSFAAGAPNSAFQQGSFPTGEPESAFQQGSFPTGEPNSAFQQGSFQNSGAPNSAFQQQSFSNPERERASVDRSASITRYENEVGPENYHFAFETDNGISAEENGVATNGVQAQGGFSYTGDDGQVYSVSYTADEGGYQPKGDHLPTPPPIPVEILKSLEQNARDEAAGLVDDGSYDAQRYNAGSDYAENEDANGKFTHQSSDFGGAQTDANFLNKNQASRRPMSGQSSFTGQAGQGSNLNGQTVNRYTQGGFGSGSNGASNGQGFNAQSGESTTGFIGLFQQPDVEVSDDDSASGQFGQSGTGSQKQTVGFGSNTGTQSQTNKLGSFSGVSTQTGSKLGQSRPGFENINEYLPPVNRPNARPQGSRPQNGRIQNSRPQATIPQVITDGVDASQPSQELNENEENSVATVPLGQQDLQDNRRPQQTVTSFGKPISKGVSPQNGFGSSQNAMRPTTGRRPSSNGFNSAQVQSSQPEKIKEYLPPNKNGNRRPSNRPQSMNTFTSQFNQQNGEIDVDSEVDQSLDNKQKLTSSPLTSSQSKFGSQSQQLNSFQRPQASRPSQNGNQFPSQTPLNSASAQSTFAFTTQKATAQPAIELTTPIETSNNDLISQSGSPISTDDSVSASQLSGRPTQASFANQYNNVQNGFDSQSSNRPQGFRPQSPRPFGQAQAPAFPTQFNQNAQLVNRPQSQSTFGQSIDAQYSSSTQRPSFTGQPQGPDDSYYYNQPSRPFGSPQASRFPSAPSNKFDRVVQQSSFSQNQLQNVPSTSFPSGQSQGSTKYPKPPTIAPTSPTSQIQGQFGNNYRKPGSTRQPKPPTLAPTIPTTFSQSQYQGSNVNGVTQASISPFPSQKPTQTSQGQFGSRPSFQQSQFNQASQSASSSIAQPTQPSYSQHSTASSFVSRRPSGSSNLQSQVQAQTVEQEPETQDQTNNNENEQIVPSQQYTGEIYEYNKPAVTLPPPDSTPVSNTQFGQKMPSPSKFGQSQPQIGQTSNEDDQRPISQFGSQPSSVQGSRPQFGVPSKPQIGQNNFGAQQSQLQIGQTSNEDAQRPMSQFGSQSSSVQGSRPQFGVQSKPQIGQNNFGVQPQPEEDSKPFGALAQSQAMFGSHTSQQSRPQFGQSRPQHSQTQSTFGQSQGAEELDNEEPQIGAEPEPEAGLSPDEETQPEGPKNQFGFVSACCKDNDSRKPAKNQYGAPSQASFVGGQKYSTNSFTGKGEQFGGPRKPPSFDEETGYHY